jgi:N-sulfoglucosamine sulfohydrolase
MTSIPKPLVQEESVVSRREALELIGKTSLVALLASACRIDPYTPSPNRPNIIYLHTHDSGRFIAPYGYDISTPNLSRFADEGMVFNQAFSASPTCSPSRAALMTGMTPGCNGMWGLAHRGWELNDYSQTLIRTLKGAGYTSALVGVQHIASGTPQACAAKVGYDTLVASPSRKAAGVAEAAAGYLFFNAPRQQPFFLDIGFTQTHSLPFNPEGSYFGYESGNPEQAEVPNPLRDTPATRQDIADFEQAASAFDDAVGRILSILETTGMAKHTLVIITTDHGAPFPGMKANHTEGGLGVMLMLRGPGGFSGGKTSDALVSQIDLYPTLCELLELPNPKWLQGQSLMPLVRGERSEVNEAVFAEFESHAVPEPQASVRTRRYKYIRRLDGSTNARPLNVDETYSKEQWLLEGGGKRPIAVEQLYDLQEDPFEQDNLVDDPGSQELLSEMRRRMVARMERFDNELLQKYRVADAPPVFAPELSSRARELPEPRDPYAELGVIYLEPR